MPRYTLSPLEQEVLGEALFNYAQTNGIGVLDALVAAANSTDTEIMTVASQYLEAEKTKRQAQLATVQTRADAEAARLTNEIATITALQGRL